MTPRQRAYQREWMQRWRTKPENARKTVVWAQRWQRAHPIPTALSQYRRRAQRLGVSFSLTAERFAELVCAPCTYCGIAPTSVHGLDRVDPRGAYTDANVVPACATCNYAKRRMTMAEFLTWADRVVAHAERSCPATRGEGHGGV